MSSPLVLVTGGSSFIGLHVIHQLIQQSYRVRTTVRNLAKKDQVLTSLKDWDSSLDYSSIEFVKADLLSDDGWKEAAQGVDYVMHIASPYPAAQPKDENVLIRPAKEGTLRALKAAKASGTCKRVIVTSSIAAIGIGNKPSNGERYTEEDWTNINGPAVNAYVKSKTFAEKVAWEYIQGEGKGMELSVVNPVGVVGPQIRVEDPATTCDMIKMMMTGGMPAVPRIGFGIVDVRDVAALHILAMTKPEANGQRYLANGDSDIRTFLQMSQALKKGLGDKAAKAPSKELPDWFVKYGSYVMTALKPAATILGRFEGISNQKALALGWKPRTPEEAIVATAQRLMDKKVI